MSGPYGGSCSVDGKSGSELDDPHIAALCEMLARMSAEAGLDGPGLVARLKEGKPLSAALSLPPPVTEAIYERARQWLAVGQNDKAPPLFCALVAINPKDADFWIGHGVCLRHEGRLAEARGAFETGASLRPAWALPHFHLAGLAMAAGDREGAAAALSAFQGSNDKRLPKEIMMEVERWTLILSTTGRADSQP